MKANYKLKKPKISFGRIKQIFYTLKEVAKLAYKIQPRLLIMLFILNVLFGFSAIPGFYIQKLILDRLVNAIGESDIKAALVPISFLILLSILLNLIRNFLSRFTGFLQRTLSRYFDSETAIMMGSKLTSLDLETIEDPDFRDKFTKIQNEAGRRAWGLVNILSDIPNYFVGFVSAVAILVIASPFIAVGVVLFSVPQFLVNSKLIRMEYELHTKLSPLRKKWGWLENYLLRNRNFLELKLLGISNFLSEKQRSVVRELLGKTTELRKKREISNFWSFLPLSIFQLGTVVWIAYEVIIKTFTIGSFQLFISSLQSAQSNLTGLVSAFLEVYENYIYVADLIWFLNLEPNIESEKKGDLIVKKVPDIEFKNVWFKYRKDSKWILKDINFKITKGEKIALVGENGAGKSTLIKLLARFYDPQKGEILVDGKNLSGVNLEKWRENLAILFQLFELYPFSARESIGYGDVKRLDKLDEIVSAAQKTGIHEFIESLPLKYENPIDPQFDKGVMPSIGQWQRFGISRMLFRKDAGIIILDEPTSNVDPEAEEKIFKELVNITRDKILIFVTQRFSTVRIADRIFVVDKGKIIEQGTHKELMNLKGKYERLYNLQAQAYNQ